MAVGEQVLLKIHRRLRRGIEPEIEVGRFLSRAGFANSPRFLGSVEYVDKEGQTTALAAAFEQVHNQGDGWTVVVNALDREIEEASLTGAASDAGESGITYSLSLIEVIGRRTGELHRAFVSGDTSDFVPEPVNRTDLKEWHTKARERAEQALELLSRLPEGVDEESRIAAAKLLAFREPLLAMIDTLVPKIAKGRKIRLHNDFHLGKILVAGNDVYIVDFAGEPSRPVEERRQKGPASRDIASMLRSFDYAARMAADRQRQRGVGQINEIEALALSWRADAERGFLQAYGATRTDASNSVQVPDGELLPLFLADKLLDEIVHEATNRPLLLSIPVKAALQLLEPAQEKAEEAVQ
jgi:maltose alpha-D-glucosyltransferase/alpha-amylase